jgi:hypothetical protein
MITVLVAVVNSNPDAKGIELAVVGNVAGLSYT